MGEGRYLSALLATGRSARRREYVVAHVGSGTFWRTDSLGALATRTLINGRSDADAIEYVEQIETGAGERARRLFSALDSWDALKARSRGARRRFWLRRLIANAMGAALSSLGLLVHVAPTRVIACVFSIWHSTPIARHIWRCTQFRILLNLRTSGYAGWSESSVREIGRRCAVEPSRNYLFNYLTVGLPPNRLDRLVNRLFDRRSVDAVAARLESTGPIVGVYLHGPLCAAVPNALRMRGLEVVRVVVPRTHGINVSESSGPLLDFFGEPPGTAVDETSPSVSGALLRHLRAGRSVYIALDKLAGEANGAEVEMLGHCFARNDGPAWLAVRSGCPVALWTTHNSPHGTVITSSTFFYPDRSLPVELRVARLSEHLYAHAEAAIRQHPEAWTCWADLSLLQRRS